MAHCQVVDPLAPSLPVLRRNTVEAENLTWKLTVVMQMLTGLLESCLVLILLLRIVSLLQRHLPPPQILCRASSPKAQERVKE